MINLKTLHKYVYQRNLYVSSKKLSHVASTFSIVGRRRDNEDYFTVSEDNTCLFVFDGHGGYKVSKYLSSIMTDI